MNWGGKIGQLRRKTISGMFERHKILTYMEAYLAVGPAVCKETKEDMLNHAILGHRFTLLPYKMNTLFTCE